jgi:hypothetical protein
MIKASDALIASNHWDDAGATTEKGVDRGVAGRG